jgi:hypothetical protein
MDEKTRKGRELDALENIATELEQLRMLKQIRSYLGISGWQALTNQCL